MRCLVCGREFADQANFCPYCGTAAKPSAAPPDAGGTAPYVPPGVEGTVPYTPQEAGGIAPYPPPGAPGTVQYAPQPRPGAGVWPLDRERYRKARTLYIVAASTFFGCSIVAATLSRIWDPVKSSDLQVGLVLGFMIATLGLFVLLAIATARVGSVLGFSGGSWAIAFVFLFCFSLISIGYMIYKMDEAQRTGLSGAGGRNRCPACGNRFKVGAVWCPHCGAQLP